jgi:hypothetical protein
VYWRQQGSAVIESSWITHDEQCDTLLTLGACNSQLGGAGEHAAFVRQPATGNSRREAWGDIAWELGLSQARVPKYFMTFSCIQTTTRLVHISFHTIVVYARKSANGYISVWAPLHDTIWTEETYFTRRCVLNIQNSQARRRADTIFWNNCKRMLLEPNPSLIISLIQF